jgi:hypothetical protein
MLSEEDPDPASTADRLRPVLADYAIRLNQVEVWPPRTVLLQLATPARADWDAIAAAVTAVLPSSEHTWVPGGTHRYRAVAGQGFLCTLCGGADDEHLPRCPRAEG